MRIMKGSKILITLGMLGVLAGGSMLAIGAAVLLKKRKNSEV